MALPPEELKALAIELSAAMPPHPNEDLTVCEDPVEREVLELTRSLSLEDQRRILHLIRMVVAGEFDIGQTLEWSDERKREFVRSLPGDCS